MLSLTGKDSFDISNWLVSFRKAGYAPEQVGEILYHELNDLEKKYLSMDLEFLDTMPVKIIIDGESNYPPELINYLNNKRPRALFCMGDISLLNRHSIFVCGARNASKKGREIAYKCGRLIAEAGYVVASGYARGVDVAAHHGALDAGGSTIAILPYGLSRFSVRRALGDVFDPENFLVVSEMPPSCGFLVKAALRRNKILVALANAVIVIEPGESGGTWHSVRKARSLQKPLFFHEGARPEIIGRMEKMGGERLDIKKGAPVLSKVYGKVSGL